MYSILPQPSPIAMLEFPNVKKVTQSYRNPTGTTALDDNGVDDGNIDKIPTITIQVSSKQTTDVANQSTLLSGHLRSLIQMVHFLDSTLPIPS